MQNAISRSCHFDKQSWILICLQIGARRGKNNNVRFPVTWNYMLKQSAFCLGLSPSSRAALSQTGRTRVPHIQEEAVEWLNAGAQTVVLFFHNKSRMMDGDMCAALLMKKDRRACWINRFLKTSVLINGDNRCSRRVLRTTYLLFVFITLYREYCL